MPRMSKATQLQKTKSMNNVSQVRFANDTSQARKSEAERNVEQENVYKQSEKPSLERVKTQRFDAKRGRGVQK